ncbi:hypothetical protein N1851_004957 [Merluccius polli]|uniref:Uncharacterized protein n=1 Tax=Merluccius polli TaxID=89951 RepID=A0AA47P9I7_MERPO|nr:hypothetical protein N1851_004957 [Merluccius polli]
MQNAAASLFTKTNRRAHIIPVLKSLHRFPVRSRVDFKVILLVFKSLNGQAHSMSLVDLPGPPVPDFLLFQGRTRTKTYGEAASSVYGPVHLSLDPLTLSDGSSQPARQGGRERGSDAG